MKVKYLKYFATFLIINLALALTLSGCGGGLGYDNASKSFQKGEYDRALKLYEQIVKAGPKGRYFNRANFMIGEIYRHQFKWDEALKHYQVAVDKEGATYLGSQSRLRISQVRDGVKVIKEARATYDNTPKPYENNDAAINDAAAEALFKLGETYGGSLESYQEAIKWYKKLVDEFPSHSRSSQAQLNIGNIYFYRLHNYKDGWPEYTKVMEKWPNSFQSSSAKETLITTKKWLDAILEDQQFIKRKQRISDEAVKTGAIARMGPNQKYGFNSETVAQAYIRIGDYWRINLKNYPAAIETYQTLIKDLPFEIYVAGDAQFKTGLLYQEIGEFDKATDAYQTLLDKWPQSFRRNETVYNMAICYETMQDYENAYKFYQAYMSFGEKEEFYRGAEQKVRQYEYDEDKDGFPFWQEQRAGTSDQNPKSRPDMKVSQAR